MCGVGREGGVSVWGGEGGRGECVGRGGGECVGWGGREGMRVWGGEGGECVGWGEQWTLGPCRTS